VTRQFAYYKAILRATIELAPDRMSISIYDGLGNLPKNSGSMKAVIYPVDEMPKE
jgi:hypothetical protein